MRHAIFLVMLSIQVTVASEPQTWREWMARGGTLLAVGDYRAAAEAYRKALVASSDAHVDERQSLAIINVLATADADAGRYAQAEFERKQALRIAEKSERKESLDYALVLAGICVLPTYTGNLAEAMTVMHQAIETNRERGPSRDLAALRGSLAQLLVAGKRYGDAEALLLESQTDLLKRERPDYDQMANILSELGFIRYDQGRITESIDFYSREIHLLENALGPGHPRLVVPLNNLAASLTKLGKAQSASEILERAVNLCDKTLGQENAYCGMVLDNYSLALRKLGRKHEATEMAARAHKIEQISDRRNGIGLTVNASALSDK
ncbi:MAG TPA: tetratricopeptide repeat protein [Bryobacteraceae bacterium]|nr:tetratricopeptide repeat protein [Bryobacteraceae bacterium]